MSRGRRASVSIPKVGWRGRRGLIGRRGMMGVFRGRIERGRCLSGQCPGRLLPPMRGQMLSGEKEFLPNKLFSRAACIFIQGCIDSTYGEPSSACAFLVPVSQGCCNDREARRREMRGGSIEVFMANRKR